MGARMRRNTSELITWLCLPPIREQAGEDQARTILPLSLLTTSLRDRAEHRGVERDVHIRHVRGPAGVPLTPVNSGGPSIPSFAAELNGAPFWLAGCGRAQKFEGRIRPDLVVVWPGALAHLADRTRVDSVRSGSDDAAAHPPRGGLAVLIRSGETLPRVGPPIPVDRFRERVENLGVHKQRVVQDDRVELEGGVVETVEGVNPQHVAALRFDLGRKDVVLLTAQHTAMSGVCAFDSPARRIAAASNRACSAHRIRPVADHPGRPVPLDTAVHLTVADGGGDGLVRVGHHDELALAAQQRIDLSTPLRGEYRLEVVAAQLEGGDAGGLALTAVLVQQAVTAGGRGAGGETLQGDWVEGLGGVCTGGGGRSPWAGGSQKCHRGR